ncbi:glutathione-specific gamma-glutamylcyclotransferase 1 [Macrosteles quadrilineatus]|uniref:glutathione-specific gamma-glutamylcyclotransferase 1 n=1 Tax=Macrosteles quadrilineatus TaxID=74068 RepID=UPI0023E0F019|nr:glutathione-specific gamma-glutamylcyclotransferase 1 [Macrosteles quadrilineatus]
MDARRRSSNSSLWVFGYGSLCWHPGFEFDHAVTGFIRGYARKFWQGNITHRGVAGKPGRVATLVEEKEGVVWGRAFQLSGEAAIPYLNNRECVLGGYLTAITTFYPRPAEDDGHTMEPFAALVYIATPSNCHWLGDAPLSEIATQIVSSSGASGHNVEYLLRLASFIREFIPEAEDNHLFTLEFMVRTRIKENNMCIKSLMGEDVSPPKSPEREIVADEIQPIREDSFEFTSRVPPKKLRCLNI